MHLKEYTYTELGTLFEAVGFSKVRAYTRAKGLHLLYPRQPLEALERSLSLLPPSIRRRVANTSICDTLLRIYLVGIK